MTTTSPLLLTALEVGKAIRLDADFGDDQAAITRAVLRLHQSGKLPGLKGIGKSLKWNPATVAKFIEGQS